MTRRATLTFCGDTSLGQYYLDRARDKFPQACERLRRDPLSFFEGVRALLEGSDALILNLETVLGERGALEPLAGRRFPGCDDPEATLKVLKSLGVTAVSLANNHAMDFGARGLLSTLEALRSQGIGAFGGGRDLAEACRPFVFEPPGDLPRVHLLGVLHAGPRYAENGFFATEDSPGVAPADLDRIADQIARIKADDPRALVLVLPHWQGLDYKEVPEEQERWCRQVVDAGADHVIAHGTHTADRIVRHGRATLYTSIGNFVFNAPGRYRARKANPVSLVVRAELGSGEAGPEMTFTHREILTDNRATGFQVQEHQPRGALEAPQKGPDGRNVYACQGKIWTTLLMKQELELLGCEARFEGKYLAVRYQDRRCDLLETETSFTSLVAFRMLRNKGVARVRFEQAGLPVARAVTCRPIDRAKARRAVRRFERAVIKPIDGHKGDGVFVDVTLETFEDCWAQALKVARRELLVESFFPDGEEARYLVIDGRCVAVLQRRPPEVVGDGRSTIAELVARENVHRARNPDLIGCDIVLDAHRDRFLARQGFSRVAVPQAGVRVLIDPKGNLSTGGTPVAITDRAHPSLKEAAERAAATMPGLDVVGVDILAWDHTAPAEPHNHIIIEANTRPGIGAHMYPMYGEPVNVCRILAQSIVRKLKA